MTELLIATQNQHKVAEIQVILSKIGYKVVMPSQVGISTDFDVEETGTTYSENSELKARAFGNKAQRLALADDSGLSVDALGGKPGVYSKRYAPGSDLDRNHKLLHELEGQENRKAAFITDLCLFDPVTQQAVHFEGKVEGEISLEVAGQSGFGYDSVFIPDGYHQTFAELGQDVKNELSHRARALAKVKEYLANQEK